MEYCGLDEERRKEYIITQLGEDGETKLRVQSPILKPDASNEEREMVDTVAVNSVVYMAMGMLFPWDVYLYKTDSKGRWICDDESKCFNTPLPNPPLETPLHLKQVA